MLGGARRPACGRYLLVPPVEESKAGDLNGDRWIQVAALARELAVNDPQRDAETAATDGKRGTIIDRNVELLLPRPF